MKPSEKIAVVYKPESKWPVMLDFRNTIMYPMTMTEAKHLYKQLGTALAIVKGKKKEVAE